MIAGYGAGLVGGPRPARVEKGSVPFAPPLRRLCAPSPLRPLRPPLRPRGDLRHLPACGMSNGPTEM